MSQIGTVFLKRKGTVPLLPLTKGVVRFKKPNLTTPLLKACGSRGTAKAKAKARTKAKAKTKAKDKDKN